MNEGLPEAVDQAVVRGGDPKTSDVNREESGIWVIQGFDLARQVLRDHGVFSSVALGASGYPMLMDDPPRHTVLRRAVSGAFSPASVSRFEPFISGAADQIVAEVEPNKEIEVIGSIAARLTIQTIARMLGIDEASSLKELRQLIDVVTGRTVETGIDPRTARTKLAATIRSALPARGAKEDGILDALVQSRSAGKELGDDDIVGLGVLLIIAGYETTTSLIGNMLYRLASNPDEWAMLRRARHEVPGFIENVLLLEPPVRRVPRVVTESVNLGKHLLKKGDRVAVDLAIANLDPCRSRPAQGVGKTNVKHLSFGHGIHRCLGSGLARLEAELVVAALLRRFGRVELSGNSARVHSTGVLDGFGLLPLVFSGTQGESPAGLRF